MKLSSHKVLRAILAGCVLITVARYVRLAILSPMRFDDAYMFLRYADNLLATGDYGWNRGERTFGCTSIPYTLYIALLKVVRLDHVLDEGQLVQLASFSWGVAALLLLHEVVKKVTRGTMVDDARVRTGLFISLVLSPDVNKHLFSGMDTTLSLFATTSILYCFLRYAEVPTWRRLLVAACSCYFAYLVRPDNGVYAVGFPLLFLAYTGR